MRDTDLDAVLPIAAADVHPCALFAPRAKLQIDGAGGLPRRRTLCDDVDNARDGTFTIERGVRSAYDLDAIHVADGDLIHVNGVRVPTDNEMIPVDLLAVDHDEDARVPVDDRVGGKPLLHDVDVRAL